jgi:hypothetical protein
VIDQEFRNAVVAAAQESAQTLLLKDAAALADESHRELMRGAKILLSLATIQAAPGQERSPLIDAATRRLVALRGRQSPSGLFLGGDNLESPPDSAFTVNDACDAFSLLSTPPSADGTGPAPHDVDRVLRMLEEIVWAATEPLLVGGVHTPNHRWEISAALARIHRSFPDPRLVERAEEWLAEGVDVDAVGLYSERSPNYAVHVSNPSLGLLADVLQKPELDEVVLRNLEATLSLIRPDETVETIQSRRQDQTASFPLSRYLAAFRDAAIRTGRGDFAAAARRAEGERIGDPELLAETLLNPRLLEQMPPEDGRTSQSYFFDTVALAGRRSEAAEVVVYGGSDYGTQRQIRSGLANNPTFCRFFAGAAILDSVRLSRSFFDMGPFRADRMRRVGEDDYVLEEAAQAAYYQPLTADDLRADGRYDLEDDGRFSASMSFSKRRGESVTMATRITARLADDCVELEVAIDSPVLPWSLEFAFREGGVLEGGVADGDGTWILPEGRGTYRVGRNAIGIEVHGAELSPRPLPYQPGQDYTFLGATDAVTGLRARVGGTAPAAFRVLVRAEREAAR